MASAAAVVTGLDAVTFNAAGLHPATASNFGTGYNMNDADDNIEALYVGGELLSAFQDSTPYPNALGERHRLESTLGWGDGLEKHRIQAVIDCHLMLKFIPTCFLLSLCSLVANAKPDLIDVPVHMAVWQLAVDKKIEEIKAQRASGINIDAGDAKGVSPLGRAIYVANVEAFKVLLEAGANPSQVIETEVSPFAIAAQSGDPTWIKLILDAKGDPNLPAAETNKLPINYALMTGKSENVKILVTAGSNLNHRSKIGATPLTDAIWYVRYTDALYLIRSGADWRPVIDQIVASLRRQQKNKAIRKEGPEWEARIQLIDLLRAGGADLPKDIKN